MRIDAISQNSTTIGRTKPTGAAAFNVQLVKNLATRSEASATAALSWCKLILQRAHSDAAWTPASASVFASMCEFMLEQLEKARVSTPTRSAAWRKNTPRAGNDRNGAPV